MPTKNIKKSYDKMYDEKKEVKEATPAEESFSEMAEADPEVVTKETREKPMTKPFMGVVTGGLNLNVRRTPDGEIIAVIPEGAQVKVLDNSEDGWYRIESPKGFVMKKFIKKGE